MPDSSSENLLPDFAWYDSQFLTSYVRAKQYITRHCPQQLATFEATLAPLRTSPQFSVREIMPLFDEPTHQLLRDTIASVDKRQFELHEMRDFGRLIVHDHPVITTLQHDLTERVSAWVGEAVEPSYNFLSLYNQTGRCEPHMDAPSAKWTVDYCIEQSAPWPIHFTDILPWPEQWESDHDNWQAQVKQSSAYQFRSYTLQERQALVFSGSSQWHYRDAMPCLHARNFCHLVFFHFLPAGLRALAEPENWADMFGIEGLRGLVIPERAKV